MQRIFNLDPQLVQDAIILAVNIFILFLLGSYLLFNPVRKLLEDRRNKVQSDIDEARKNKEEAEALKAQYDEQIKNADKEADKILADARKQALIKEDTIISEAKAEAGRILERANGEIELEKKKATDDIKKEIISVAALMAGKVVKTSIDTNIQESLVEDTLNEMGDKTWQNE